jgi:hypothetical protein
LHCLQINACPGELIQDFQIYLSVTENSPIVGMKAKLPVIGPIPSIQLSNKAAKVHVNLSLVEQVRLSYKLIKFIKEK